MHRWDLCFSYLTGDQSCYTYYDDKTSLTSCCCCAGAASATAARHAAAAAAAASAASAASGTLLPRRFFDDDLLPNVPIISGPLFKMLCHLCINGLLSVGSARLWSLV